MIRTILFFLFLILYVIYGIPFLLVIWLLKLFRQQNAVDHIAHFYVRVACRCGLFIAGVQVDARGLENLINDRASVIVLNHRSIFDIIATYAYFKRPTGFIAKKELQKLPVFAYWLTLANGLFLDRKNIRSGLKTILLGVEKVNRGVSMCIFPEGTRNKDRHSKTSLLPFHDASLKLAEKTGAPIVPIALYNTADVFENHAPKMRATKIKMTVGAPIYLDRLSDEDRRFLGRHVHAVMEEMMAVYQAEE